MSGTTSRLGLYLPGGGSTGSYGADEVADIDKLNQSFVKIDGHLYPAVADLTALVALLPNVPNGAIVAVRNYTLTGAMVHDTSVWEKRATSGKWRLLPGSNISFYGDANFADALAFGNAVSTFVSNNAASIELFQADAVRSAGAAEARWNGSAWKGFDSGWYTMGGVTVSTGASTNLYETHGRYRYRAGRVLFEGGYTLNGAQTQNYVRIGLPVNADTYSAEPAVGVVRFLNASDSYRNFMGLVLQYAADTVELQPIGNASGVLVSTTTTAPFGEAWAQSDATKWVIEYNPA